MNKKQKVELKKLVEGGKWNYVFTYGGRFALICYILYWLSQEYIFHEEFYVIVNIIVWGISGLIYGLWGWSSINKKLKEK